jgi:uncharacterized protein YllA (UPF0747 family)
MSYSPFRTAYLSQADSLRPFYEFPPSAASFEASLQARQQYPVDRATLVEVLERQHPPHLAPAAVREHILQLREPTTFCVTTGQQPALYGGPLMTLYKALTAIQLCQALQEQFPGYSFVPVFWSASEDHDFAEVNHTAVDYKSFLTYPGAFQGAVGRHIIDRSIEQVAAPADWLRALYRPGRSWGEAFRATLLSLLGPQGLIVLDADEPRLKRQFIDALDAEVRGEGIEPAVSHTSAALRQAGFPQQAIPQAVNCFQLTDHGRYRIEPTAGGQLLLHASQSRVEADTLRTWLRETPEAFSPNALLRPLYQETLLPNLIYVGGWGELGYWFQLREAFRQRGTFFPLLWPRPSALLSPAGELAHIVQYGFTMNQLLEPDAFVQQTVQERLFPAASVAPYRAAVASDLQALADFVAAYDAGQHYNVRAEQRRLAHFFDHLTQKLQKAALNRHPEALEPLLRYKRRLQPDGYTQERVLNFQAFAAAEPDKLIQQLLARFKWDEAALQLIELDL